MLMTVYDAKGEPFEVKARIAKQLVVYEGWNFTLPEAPAPVVAEPEAIVLAPVFPKRVKVPAPAPTE